MRTGQPWSPILTSITLLVVDVICLHIPGVVCGEQGSQPFAAAWTQETAAEVPAASDAPPFPPVDVAPVTVAEKMAVRPIRAVSIDIRLPEGKLPAAAIADDQATAAESAGCRDWAGAGYTWEAPAFFHRPLYYEDVNAERLGYSRCRLLQPALSGAHFFATTLALPYLMACEPPQQCVSPLGHYRPGSCVPYRRNWPELRPAPAAVEGAIVTGLIFAIP